MPKEGSAEWFRVELAKMGESSKGTKSTLEMRYEAIMSQQRAALKPRGANEGRARTPIRSRSPSKSPEVKKAIAKAAPKASKPIRKPTLAKKAPAKAKPVSQKSPAASPRGKSPACSKSPGRGKSPARSAKPLPEVNTGWVKDKQLGKSGKEGTCYLVPSTCPSLSDSLPHSHAVVLPARSTLPYRWYLCLLSISAARPD